MSTRYYSTDINSGDIKVNTIQARKVDANEINVLTPVVYYKSTSLAANIPFADTIDALVINWTTPWSGSLASVTVTNSRITFDVAGIYTVFMSFPVSLVAGSFDINPYLKLNNTTTIAGNRVALGTIVPSVSFSATLYFNAADYVEVRILATAPGLGNDVTCLAAGSRLSVVRVA